MPRVVKFAAKDLAAAEGEFALTVGFARDSNDERTDDGLMLQRAKEGESDDDGIYIEVPIQRYACYGGVKEAEFAVDHFSISFTAETTQRLGDISAMKISFKLLPAEFETMAAMLQRIFRDHEHFSVKNG